MARRGSVHAVLFRSLATVVLCVLAQGYALGDGGDPGYVPGRVLVRFQPGTPASEVARAHAAARAAVLNQIHPIGVQVVELPRGLGVARGIGLYQRNPNVEYAEPDYLVAEQATTPNDPWYPTQSYHFDQIRAAEAWDVTQGVPGVMIAVLDSGLAYDHPDVQGRYVLGPDFINHDDDPWDDNGHGTGVYGVVGAATNNQTGIASVSWHNPVLVMKVGDYSGYGSVSAICEGLTYAADLGARAANLSYAGTAYSQALQDAIDYAWSRGMLTVCAAGNYGDDTPRYPAACTNAVAVSAIDGYDRLAHYSSYGAYIDVCAPQYMRSLLTNGSYGNWAGTSIAAPYVAGAIALVASVNPALSAQQLLEIIEQTADDLGNAGWDEYYGWGKINLHRAVLAAGQGPVEDTAPPAVSITEPISGSVVRDLVSVSAAAADDVGVTKVEFYVDGEVLAADEAAPYVSSWNTHDRLDGTYTLIAVAYDAAGNFGQSAPVSVIVDNTPPTASIVMPAPGSVVSGTVSVEAEASDQIALNRVDFYLDGQKKSTAYKPPYVWSWDTREEGDGRRTFVACAVDAAGNDAASQPVEIVVENQSGPVAQTEVFPGRAGGRNGWVSVWVTTTWEGMLDASLTTEGRTFLSLYLCDAAGGLLVRDLSPAHSSTISLYLPPGQYEFRIGSDRFRSNFVLRVTHF